MSASTVAFDPMAPGFFDDPYAQYAALRESDPIHRSPAGLMCFRYADVWRLLREPATTMGVANAPASDGRRRPEPRLFPRALLNLDPPDHPRVRRLMSRIFTPRKIDAMSSWIAAEVEVILDRLEERARETGEPVDLFAELAFPLPFKVISDILGMPKTDEAQVRVWAQSVTEASLGATSDGMEHATSAYEALCSYVTSEVLPWKRANPGDDLLSVLLTA